MSSDKPNLLLLIFDDLRADALGCYGNPVVKTPNIDRLAAQSFQFNNAHTPCPICSASRASMFSGMRPQSVGVTTLKEKVKDKHPDLVTWPHAMRQSGWTTMRSGKIFHKGVPDCLVGRGDGADDPEAWDIKSNPPGYELHSNGVFKNLTPWDTHTAGTGGMIAWLKAEKQDNKQHDARVVEDVIEQMKQWQGQPWMIGAGFIRPHVPFVAPRRFFEMYDRDDIILPEPGLDDASKPEIANRRFGGGFSIPPEDQRDAILAYYATISFVDEHIGHLLDYMEAEGLMDSTQIILTADHGFHLGEHNLWFKYFPYRGSTHIPLLWHDPSRPESYGQSTDALTDNVDVFPTLCENLSITAPHPMEGKSLNPLIAGEVDQIHDAIFSECHGSSHGYGMRSMQHLYIQWYDAKHESLVAEELYDVIADPEESCNLACDTELNCLKKSMSERLIREYQLA